jgi:hypothetical protein
MDEQLDEAKRADQILLQAECLVAVMGISRAIEPKPKAPSDADLKRAAKLPETIKKSVAKLVAATSQGKQSEPPELPDYQATGDALAEGTDLDALTDALLPVSPEQLPSVTMTITRGVQYLAGLFPRRVEQRLTGPYQHPASPGEWAEFGWAWRVANQPLYVLDLATDGMLIGAEVGHLKALYPSIYSQICGDILDDLAEKAADDKDWMAPWWLQKQICTILGISPVSTTLVADIDAAVKQSQAETKTRASALKLSQTGQTTSEKLAENPR